jgi:hypothetical protein
VGSGNVTLELPDSGSQADVLLSVGSGNTTLHLGNVKGRVRADSGSGNVTLKLTDPGSQADVTLTTGAGNMVLDLPPKSSGKFDLESGSGIFSVEGLEILQLKRNRVSARSSAQVGEHGPATSCTPARVP